MVKFAISIAIVLLSPMIYAQPSGYSYVRQITTHHTEIAGASNLIDFPLLVSLSLPDLRSTFNGGHIENVNAGDIMFTSSDCSTILDHQIETYNAFTGELIVWVRIPALPPTTNHDILMYYGNPGITTSASTTSVWPATYSSVWHMNESPDNSAPQLNDYSSHTNNGTANGGMNVGNLVNAKIGLGLDFDGIDDYIDCGQDISLNATTNLTVSAWIYPRVINGHVINMGGGWDDPGFSMFQLGGTFRVELQNATEKEVVFNSNSLNQWAYWVFTYDQTTGNVTCYINGVLQPNMGNFIGPIGPPVEALNIGRKEQNGFYFNGIIDEGRVILETKSANWIQTEYNNQNNPNNFYSVSPELAASLICAPLPSQLISFETTPLNNNAVEISWQTGSEQNSDFFELQRSKDGEYWEAVETVAASGISTSLLQYKSVDQTPYTGTSYYRLKLVDIDGNSVLSKLRSVHLLNEEPFIYPNPAKNIINIEGIDQTIESIQLFDPLGKKIPVETKEISEGTLNLNISPLTPGIYYLHAGKKCFKLIKE